MPPAGCLLSASLPFDAVAVAAAAAADEQVVVEIVFVAGFPRR